MLITQEEIYPVIFTGNGKAPDDDYEKFAENIENFEYVQLAGRSKNISDTSQPLVLQTKDHENLTVLVPVIASVASVFLVMVVILVLIIRQKRQKSVEMNIKLCDFHSSISLSSSTNSEVKERFLSK